VSGVHSSIAIAAAPAAVWAVVMNPHRFAEWVTIHRELRSLSADPPREGTTMEQTLHLRGADIHVRWLLVACTEPRYARWEGTGPARSSAHIEYRLTATPDGTRFDYSNEFRAPLGPVGALASRTVMGGAPQREADRSLAALRELIERPAR
jgi:carbon monoxide dehydrogenase subunit G